MTLFGNRPADRVPSRASGFPGGGPAVYLGYSLAVIATITGLYAARNYSYTLYHSLIEIFTIVVAAGVFMIAWNSRRVIDNNYLLFIGIAYLFVAAIDIIHTLSYKGVGVFPTHGANLPTQLWVVARYIQALSLVIAPLFLGRKMRVSMVFLGYAVVVTFAFLAIFQFHWCPTCFVEGAGLTRFKEISEYVISFLLLLSIYMLYRKRSAFDRGVFWLLVSSITLTILSELSFTLYTDPYGFANFMGHIFRLGAFYLIYKAIIETGLSKPVDLLFRNLKKSEEELRKTNVELEGYAHTVSHDLRGPLSAIAIADAMLKEEAAAPRVRDAAPDMEHYADVIDRNVNKSYDLIDDLLSLARAGQTPTNVEEVEVSEVVSRILDELAGGIGERGIRVEADPDLGTIKANPTQVYQVFSNLIGNAVRHNDSSEPVVEIRYLGEDEQGLRRYRVRDNGSGIPPEILDNVFEPFVKGERGGTGIGLATVSRIIDTYGGAIKAYNENGACFDFFLRDAD